MMKPVMMDQTAFHCLMVGSDMKVLLSFLLCSLFFNSCITDVYKVNSVNCESLC